MLEGLEISEINYAEAITNKDFRTDSDFWTKASKPNSKLKYVPIGEILLNSQYGISIEMNELGKGYPIYRMNEVHNMVCDFEVDKCADILDDEFKIFELNDRDVLFNRTNSYEWVGRTGVFKKQAGKNFVFASYLVRFVPNQEKVLPEYLASFLSSKFGVNEIRRRARQSINQTNVNPEEVKAIRIPLLNFEIQNSIKNCFDIAVENLLQSQQLYAAAEILLLDTLGMADSFGTRHSRVGGNPFSAQSGEQSPDLIKPLDSRLRGNDGMSGNDDVGCGNDGLVVNIKSFKDSFVATGRLDAEYYQPKYEAYQAHVFNSAAGWDSLANICNLKDSNYTPKEASEYAYIELADIDKSGGITGCTRATGKELPSRARRKVAAGDVLVSSIEGSLTSCAIVPKSLDGALCSTGFYVVNSGKINSETLLVLFKSELMQNLLKQGCSGTILTAVNKTEFQNIAMPIIDSGAQTQIAALIQTSFALKAQSEHLLAIAKRAVEIAIEQDEAAGMCFMMENTVAKTKLERGILGEVA